MNKRIYLIFLLIISLFIGCLGNLENYKKEACIDMPNDNVLKAIHDNCISCHKTDFTTKKDICVRKKMIIDAVSTDRMPKMGKLYPHYKKTLLNWK